MSSNARAEVVYGVCFEEGFELPWFHEGVEDWWRRIKGFIDQYQPFTDSGDWAPGWSNSDSRLKGHYERRRVWHHEHPLPFFETFAGHYDYQSPVLYVPGTQQLTEHCDRLESHETPDDSEFMRFMKEFEIEYGRPAWLLIASFG